MELDKIKEVKHIHSMDAANQLLEKGWVLSDAKVVQLGNAGGIMEDSQCYILGRT